MDKEVKAPGRDRLLTAAAIRREKITLGPTKFNSLMREPDAPKPAIPAPVRYWRESDVDAWLSRLVEEASRRPVDKAAKLAQAERARLGKATKGAAKATTAPRKSGAAPAGT